MPAPGGGTARRGVRVEDALACPRFCGRVIEGIDANAPTPSWIRQRIERSGIRSISAVVDVTNYVMLELGQPLHAYDDALLEGDIVVRFARPGEQLTLLNGQRVDLDPDLLLVADEKKPLGLAGIMGGEHSGIGSGTTTVFLEGAFWNPAVIQGKARRLGFATDAGFRFERGVDFAIGPAAVDRATQLIIETLRRPRRRADRRSRHAAAARSGARAQRARHPHPRRHRRAGNDRCDLCAARPRSQT